MVVACVSVSGSMDLSMRAVPKQSLGGKCVPKQELGNERKMQQADQNDSF